MNIFFSPSFHFSLITQRLGKTLSIARNFIFNIHQKLSENNEMSSSELNIFFERLSRRLQRSSLGV